MDGSTDKACSRPVKKPQHLSHALHDAQRSATSLPLFWIYVFIEGISPALSQHLNMFVAG